MERNCEPTLKRTGNGSGGSQDNGPSGNQYALPVTTVNGSGDLRAERTAEGAVQLGLKDRRNQRPLVQPIVTAVIRTDNHTDRPRSTEPAVSPGANPELSPRPEHHAAERPGRPPGPEHRDPEPRAEHQMHPLHQDR